MCDPISSVSTSSYLEAITRRTHRGAIWESGVVDDFSKYLLYPWMLLCQGIRYLATVGDNKLLPSAMEVKHEFQLLLMSYQEVSHGLCLWLGESTWPVPILLQALRMSGRTLGKVESVVSVEIYSRVPIAALSMRPIVHICSLGLEYAHLLIPVLNEGNSIYIDAWYDIVFVLFQ